MRNKITELESLKNDNGEIMLLIGVSNADVILASSITNLGSHNYKFLIETPTNVCPATIITAPNNNVKLWVKEVDISEKGMEVITTHMNCSVTEFNCSEYKNGDAFFISGVAYKKGEDLYGESDSGMFYIHIDKNGVPSVVKVNELNLNGWTPVT